MPLLENHPAPVRPAAFAEQRILEAILDRSYGPGDALPGERALSQALGVTRPTIRETLQRLAREGWVTIAHGKATRVNDYLSEGGLGLLGTLARYGHHLSHDLVSHLLQTRTLLLPGVALLAAEKSPVGLLSVLARAPEDIGNAEYSGQENSRQVTPLDFARFDWELQREMVILSGNPVVRMIFNDFEPVYQVMGERYFSHPETRTASLAYYQELAEILARCSDQKADRDIHKVRQLVAEAMGRAERLWKEQQ